MKTYAPPRPPRHIRVPAFLPVPLRGRADGWTRERQAAFLVALAATSSVAAAARKVGMARQTAYRLRERPGAESFARAWDAVLGRGGTAKWKVTPEERMRRALDGLIRPRVWREEMRGISTKTDNSALLAVLRQLDRGASDADREAGR